MSRVLLVDDSPHAQRIGEQILSDEGFEVVTVSNADSALIRLDDAEPDIVIAKAVMPGRSGFEICKFIKMNPRHRYVRVILTSGAMEKLDDAEVKQSGADSTLRKPFEATALLDTVRPLVEAAVRDKETAGQGTAPRRAGAERPAGPNITTPVIAVVDPEQVRAAVTVALDAAMPAMIEEITNRVVGMLLTRREQSAGRIVTRGVAPPIHEEAAVAPPAPPRDPLPAAAETVRPVTRAASPYSPTRARALVRPRAGSILGLDMASPELPPAPAGGEDTK